MVEMATTFEGKVNRALYNSLVVVLLQLVLGLDHVSQTRLFFPKSRSRFSARNTQQPVSKPKAL
jgi:hypothetical protein